MENLNRVISERTLQEETKHMNKGLEECEKVTSQEPARVLVRYPVTGRKQ